MKHILIFAVTIILLSACGARSNQDEKTPPATEDKSVALTPQQLKNAGIATGKMEQREIASVLKLNGKIDVPPQNMVSISVPLGGYLKTTQLLPGMHVNKGQVIAVMQDQQYIQLQQDYLTAKAKIGFLENEYKRQKELNQSQSSSDKVYQLAESDYKSQQVLMTSLAAKLQLAGINVHKINETTISPNINIYSPINGYVSKVNVNIGKYVSSTEVLFELINVADIHLALKVFEKNVNKLFIGQKLIAYTNNDPEKKYPCEILLIGKDLSVEGNTEVHCHFEQYDNTLVPGTYMNAEIEVKNNQAFALPTDAIVRFESKQFVYKVKGKDQFEMTEVVTGESENGFVEIVIPRNSDLAGSEFVTKGAYSLLMMMKNKAE
jgi:cobalt-zinc-cadmium efflux system membrane fusion protein